MTTRHKAARAAQISSALTSCTDSAQQNQNKGFLRRELSATSDQEAREKQIPLPPLRDRDDEEGRQERPKNRSEDRPLHQKGRGGMGGGAIDRRKERSLHSASRRATIRRGRKNRAAPVGMTAWEEWQENPRTGLKTGHYLRKREAGTVDLGHDVSCAPTGTERTPRLTLTKRGWGAHTPKTHPCINQTRKDGPPRSSTIASQRLFPISFIEFGSSSLLCYVAVHSLAPSASCGGRHPRKHRKFFMERHFKP